MFIETGNENFFHWCIRKTNNLKIRLWKQDQLQGSFGLCNKTENAISSLWSILKPTNLRIRLQNRHPIQGKLAIKMQALIWNFPICIGNKIKDQFEHLKISLNRRKGENYLRCQFTMTLWGLSLLWQHERLVKTLGLTINPWSVAGLCQYKLLSSSYIICFHGLLASNYFIHLVLALLSLWEM